MKYLIPEGKIESLQKTLRRFQKKAPDIIKFELLDEYEYVDKPVYQIVFDGRKEEKKLVCCIKVKCQYIEVEGNYKINGWEFLAKIEHLNNGNLLTKSPEVKEDLSSYHQCSPWCEHCKTNRDRKETFLVKNLKTNSIKQVGRQCLMEYTQGLDAEIATQYASLIEEIILKEEIDEDYLEQIYSSRSYDIDSEDFKKKAFTYIKSNGYSKEETAVSILNPENNIELASDEDMELLNKYIESFSDYNEYEHNVKVLWQENYYKHRHLNFILSAIAGYFKRLTSTSNSNYLGQVKDRITFKIKSLRVLYSGYNNYSYYDDSIIYTYKIIEDNDNVIIWKTDKTLKEGQTYKATIKSLEEYKGEKQTVVTRGSLIEDQKIPEEIKGTGECEKALDEFFKTLDLL